MRALGFLVCALLALPATAAERHLDFGQVGAGQLPPGFRSTVSGQGKPGEWKVLLEDVPPLLAGFNRQTASTKQPVLAQLSQDPTDDHYPLLVLDDEEYGDFTLTTHFKLVSGAVEEMAGVAFRIQDEKNYYYVRASGLGDTFYFFKFVKGQLIGPIGSKVPISKGVWHQLSVECKGSLVSCSLDGKMIIPQMRQDDFPKGKIGFWTKSDSVSDFGDTTLVYTPLVDPAQPLVRDLAHKYARLLALKLYVLGRDRKTTRVVGSKDPAEVGRLGAKTELAVITQGQIYYGKEQNSVAVIMPVRDRNGDIIAAARVVMRSFPGQTEENAVARALPIVRAIQARTLSLQDLIQ